MIWQDLSPVQQGLVNKTQVGTDHQIDRRIEILHMPLEDQGDLGADKAAEDISVGCQLGGVQKGQDDLVFLFQEVDALVDQQIQQIVADDDIQKVFFVFPEGQVLGNDLLLAGGFRQVGSHFQKAGMELPADDALETGILIGEIIVKRLPGNAQLVAKIGNADGRIGPMQKIFKQTILDLLLAAVGGYGTGNVDIVHFFSVSG